MITSINKYRKINEGRDAYCETCGEHGYDEDLDRNCTNCGDFNWTNDYERFENNESVVKENASTTNVVKALSDIDEIRPDRMKKPPQSSYNSFAGKGGVRGYVYIQDEAEEIMQDKYGRERGTKLWNASINAPQRGAMFKMCSDVMKEKEFLFNDLQLHPSDYWQYSYFGLWKLWMDKYNFPYKIPTADDIQFRKDEAERIKKEKEEQDRLDKINQNKRDFDNRLAQIQNNYSSLLQFTPDAKDMKRIEDIFAKGNYKYTNIEKMANSIKDKAKAARRGNAVIKYLQDNQKFDRWALSHAETFFQRANNL